MMYNTRDHWVFVTLSIVQYLKNRTFRKLDLFLPSGFQICFLKPADNLCVGNAALFKVKACGFPQSLYGSLGVIPLIVSRTLLPYPFQFIIHLLSYRSTLYSFEIQKAYLNKP
jgi:hypothetical protein